MRKIVPKESMHSVPTNLRPRKTPGIPGSPRLLVALILIGLATPARPDTRFDPYYGFIAADETGGLPSTNGDIDSPMFLDPYFSRYDTIKQFHPDLKTLWLKALDQPDLDTRRQAIKTIGLAHTHGMPNLIDIAPHLIEKIESAQTDEVERYATIQAVDRLDARDGAKALWQRVRDQLDRVEVAVLSDTMLARWDYKPGRSVWMKRINNPKTPYHLFLSSIRSLQTVKHGPAGLRLKEIAIAQTQDPATRLAAARALGVIVSEGLEPTSQTLAGGSITDRLVAVSLIAHHSGAAAVAQLIAFAVDPEPSVIAIALTRLLEIDSLLIKPIGNGLLLNEDAKVRRLAAEGVFAQKTPEALAALGPLLNDLNPSLRIYVRRRMIEQEKLTSLSRAVRDVGMKLLKHQQWRDLAGSDLAQRIKSEWRGLEQAALLLGTVDHKPAVDDLMDLLVYPRREPRTAVAVALRRLSIEGTFKPLLVHAEKVTEWALHPDQPLEDPNINNGMKDSWDVDEQIAQILQLFGTVLYRSADALMRNHIPKRKPSPGPKNQSRAASIWALGHFYQDNLDQALADQLRERMTDLNPNNPEYWEVRRMSAIAIGRMKAEECMPSLEAHYEMELRDRHMAGAMRWSIHRITGEWLPEHGPFYPPQSDYFLVPTNKIDGDVYWSQR